MIDRNLVREWIIKACNLHPETQEFCAISFGEFEYVANCAYQYAHKNFIGLTEEEQDSIFKKFSKSDAYKRDFLNRIATAVEEKLLEKNT